MTDEKLWEIRVQKVRDDYALLSPSVAGKLVFSLAALKKCKSRMQALVDKVQGGIVCASCKGECCARGKYHFTTIDLLAYLTSGETLFTPLFGRDLCPYLDERGCMMTPEYRPFNCITFNCDRVECLLEPAEVELFYLREKELRSLYETVEEELGNYFKQGLLMDAEQVFVLRDAGIFGTEMTDPLCSALREV